VRHVDYLILQRMIDPVDISNKCTNLTCMIHTRKHSFTQEITFKMTHIQPDEKVILLSNNKYRALFIDQKICKHINRFRTYLGK
jgi:hypothetical protein